MVTMYYITYKPERELAFASIKYMATYPWVQDIILIHTDKERPDFDSFPRLQKTYHYWQFFGGEGISNAGGIDEVDTRNMGIKLATLTTTDWIMQCDSDEIFVAEPGFDFSEVEQYDGVLFEMHHFLQPNRYRTEGLPIFDGLFDPHIRIWRKSLWLRHAIPEHPIIGCDNPTGHTHFDAAKINYLKMQRRLAHIHFRDLTHGKNRNIDHLECVQWDLQWPKEITELTDWRF